MSVSINLGKGAVFPSFFYWCDTHSSRIHGEVFMSPVAVVVDDDPDIRDVIVYMLELAGFVVHVESNGEAGLALVLAVQPDVVLLDWMMPRMSGVEVCETLRTTPAVSSVAIVMLTAKAQEYDVQSGFDAGADDYIVKPFSPKQLVERIQNVLSVTENRKKSRKS
jgi:DNA-binding response OmpR family regulator